MQKRGFRIVTLTLAVCFFGFIVSCGNSGGGGSSDIPPIANAGSDQNVLAGWKVTLDATGSTGLVSTITWSFTSKPAGSAATLSSLVTTKPTFTADKAGSYTLSLVIGNGKVTSSPDAVTIMAVNPRALPDTGQTTSYAVGDDGTYLSTAPSYSDNGDGTITDKVTGLMWQKCTSWLSGSLCSGGTLTAYNWYQASGTASDTYNAGGAINACGGNILGYSDWRLPADFELMSIVDYGTSAARAINTTYFPGTQLDYYWVSTPSAINDTLAWSVEFGAGVVSTGPKASVSPWALARCVRGEQSAPVLTDNNDGTITDNVSRLMWQKQDDGLTENWQGALTYCEGLSFGGHTDWRVPNIRELHSIVDATKYGPSIDTAYFTKTKTSYYWSSTSVAANPTTYAWIVSFNSGSVNNTVNKITPYYVRCVRSIP